MDSRKRAACLLALLQILTTAARAKEIDIGDTRTATSETGYYMGENDWIEASSSIGDNDRRAFQICKITEPETPDYWFRSYHMQTEGVNTLFIEMEFTVRACDKLKVKKLHSCKETFTLYYLEADDEDVGRANQMNPRVYKRWGTIAADERFHEDEKQKTNKKTVSIHNLNTRGLYLAFQDTGACLQIVHVRVYYKACDATVADLTRFGQTNTGPIEVSHVRVRGTCVRNAQLLRPDDPVERLCNSQAEWSVRRGSSCACRPGYEPYDNNTKCQECPVGKYKDVVSRGARCEPCPPNSVALRSGTTRCQCRRRYYRASADPAASACTQPPSAPMYPESRVNKTVIKLSWRRPAEDGGRTDIRYQINCWECDPQYLSCYTCSSSSAVYKPGRTDVRLTQATVSNLRPHTHYKFKILSLNGVSEMSGWSPEYAELRVKTNEKAPSKVGSLRLVSIGAREVRLVWASAASSSSPISAYEVTMSVAGDDAGRQRTTNITAKTQINFDHLRPETRYTVKVRARNSAGSGLFSDEVTFETHSLDPRVTAFPVTSNKRRYGGGGGDLSAISGGGKVEGGDDPAKTTTTTAKNERAVWAVAAVCTLCVIAACVVLVALSRRKKKYQRAKSGDSSDHDTYPTLSDRSGSSSRSYVDPSTYEDPFLALSHFTKEIDKTRISIVRKIGGGEFGDVCQGTLAPDGRVVAIKQLRSGYGSRDKENFLGEASIMGQFDHPNVIKLEGVVSKCNPYMIVTEYMENGSLDVFLRENPQSLSTVVVTRMLYQIAHGMRYLAEMGYVHRDLAARNVLLDRRLTCKVSDFGLSRILEDVSDDIATYTTRGGMIPIRWTALEAITKRTFTSSSDVWSYGIVMWEVMTFGERPYWELANKDVIQLVESGYRLPPPRLCPKALHTLMLDCWKHDRLERPTFAELVNILGHFLNEPSVLESCLNCRSPCEQEYCIPDILDLVSLGQWLQQMHLLHFKPVMLQHGCVTAEQIMRLTPTELELMGITNPCDIDTILRGAVNLRYKIAEVNHVGISV